MEDRCMKIFKILFLVFFIMLLYGCDKTYRISFETNTEQNIVLESIDYKVSQEVELPTPEWENYKFDGW